jgi:hypothetical protein
MAKELRLSGKVKPHENRVRAKFSGSSLNPFFLFIALTLGIMSVPATAVIDTNFPQSSQALICPPSAAVLHRFIADSAQLPSV